MEGTVEDFFQPETWNQHTDNYRHDPNQFTRPEPGVSMNFRKVPNPIGLFHHFIKPSSLREIAKETNRYASEVIKDDGGTRGGPNWSPVTYKDLEGYFAICIFMSVKRLPNLILYWSREHVLYHCL